MTTEIEATDLLFIDTLHTFEQMERELGSHAGKARKFLVFHDTTTFGYTGELPGTRGIWPAIEAYFANRPYWRLIDRWMNNNGLTVYMRRE